MLFETESWDVDETTGLPTRVYDQVEAPNRGLAQIAVNRRSFGEAIVAAVPAAAEVLRADY